MMFFIESISYKEANRYLFWNNVSINDVLPLPGTKIPISISESPSKLHLTTSEVVNIIYLLEKKYIRANAVGLGGAEAPSSFLTANPPPLEA